MVGHLVRVPIPMQPIHPHPQIRPNLTREGWVTWSGSIIDEKGVHCKRIRPPVLEDRFLKASFERKCHFFVFYVLEIYMNT